LRSPAAALALLGAACAGWLLAARGASASDARWLFGGILLVRVLGLFVTPELSDDLYRYVHEGRASRLGLAVPYATPPAEITPPPDDGITARVNHPEVPAAYPPTSQLFFLAVVAAGDLFGAPLGTLRFALLAVELCVVALLYRRRREHPRAFVLYGLHPLPLLEVAISAHLDALGVALVVAGAVGARPAILRGLLIGLAVGVKPIAALALLALPLRRHALWRGALGLALGIALPTLPYLIADAPLTRGLVEYGTRWEAQPTGYAIARELVSPAFDAREAEDRWTHAHLTFSPPGLLVEEAGEPRLSLGSARRAERPLLVDRRLVARGLMGAAFLIVLGLVLLRVRDPWARTAWAFAALWLASPTMHPWYLLWPLPFAALSQRRGILAWAAVAPLAYEAAMTAAATSEWREALWPRLLMLLALALGTALDRASARRPARGSS
jgi:hypothetical protein